MVLQGNAWTSWFPGVGECGATYLTARATLVTPMFAHLVQFRGRPSGYVCLGPPTVHQPLQSSLPVPDPLDDSPFPNCPVWDIVLTERDKQLLAELRRVRNGSPALHCLSPRRSQGRKP